MTDRSRNPDPKLHQGLIRVHALRLVRAVPGVLFEEAVAELELQSWIWGKKYDPAKTVWSTYFTSHVAARAKTELKLQNGWTKRGHGTPACRSKLRRMISFASLEPVRGEEGDRGGGDRGGGGGGVGWLGPTVVRVPVVEVRGMAVDWRTLLSRLNQREQEVIRRRRRGETFSAIALVIGTSKEWVRQVEAKAIQKMRGEVGRSDAVTQ